MRKNTARHWLHAGLDLLPLILIPVFMIYSHRHTIDSGSIEVPVNRVVDFNQILPNGNFETTSLWSKNVGTTGTFIVSNNVASLTFGGQQQGGSAFQLYQYLNVIESHEYILSFQYKLNSTPSVTYANINLYNGNDNITTQEVNINVWNTIEGKVIPISTSSSELGLYVISNDYLDNDNLLVKNAMLFDLTQMFGAGNEPTLVQFKQWYPNEYYEYTLSSKQLLKGYSSKTFDDTDIMSQFTYQLYNSVDKYFNMGNVFGMSNVYDWFNLNIFGGNASISIYIVWNIVLYEFVMDLLFLLYALFMWFIDVTKRLIEKPLDSIK